MGWNNSDRRVCFGGHRNDHEKRRGSLHGLNTCLGWSFRSAALVCLEDLYHLSLDANGYQEPCISIHNWTASIQHTSTYRPPYFLPLDCGHPGTETRDLGD